MLGLTMQEERAADRLSHPPWFLSPWLLWMVWLIWLPFMIPEILQLLKAPRLASSPVALAGHAAFVAIYVFFSFRVARDLSGRTPWRSGFSETLLGRLAVTSALVALGAVVQFLGAPVKVQAGSLFIFAAAYAGTALSIPRGIATNAAVLAVCVVCEALTGVSFTDILQPFFVITVVTFMTLSFSRAIIVGRKLHEARGEIARLAAADERLRIARDLHDLLGQKLSFLALKSELARYLVATDPSRAQAEMAEVETTARSTLQEVREAVAGYRRPDLARELRAAGEILAAAGIRFQGPAGPIPPTGPSEREALAWAVREGVTNIIRHSRAAACVIELKEQDGAVTMRIADDGAGVPRSGGAGHGLRGLQERFEAVGGTLRAGRSATGFVLAGSVPARTAS